MCFISGLYEFNNFKISLSVHLYTKLGIEVLSTPPETLFFSTADNSYSSDNLNLQASLERKLSVASIINAPFKLTLYNSKIAECGLDE